MEVPSSRSSGFEYKDVGIHFALDLVQEDAEPSRILKRPEVEKSMKPMHNCNGAAFRRDVCPPAV